MTLDKDKIEARISDVYLTGGELTRACQAYAELREHYGDHKFERELMMLCLAYGRALNMPVK